MHVNTRAYATVDHWTLDTDALPCILSVECIIVCLLYEVFTPAVVVRFVRTSCLSGSPF